MPAQYERAPEYSRVSTTLDTSVGATDQTLKTSAGLLLGFDAANTHATEWVYLKLYDASSVTVSSAAPTYSFALPPASVQRVEFEWPRKFLTAIHYACAQERAAGATAPTTAPSIEFRYV